MAYRVEIRPPDAPIYSLARLFDDFIEACDEGTSYRHAPLYARFDVKSVDPELAAHHFAQRAAFESAHPAPTPAPKPMATDVMVARYVRDNARRAR
jgi:hypothetical protein